jgi:phospholipid/cholesterol/gamma-HCH transport system substrate-binding protein
MARRNPTELIAGAVVLAVAAGFLGYAVAHTGRSSVSGYTLRAKFDRIDGLNLGSDVRLAGVKVGSVSSTAIDPKTYQAVVTFSVQDSVRMPVDSSAEVTSDGMLGGKFLALVPGGDEKMLANGGEVTITQSSVSLEQLLGKFIFSVSDLATNVQKQLRSEQPPK